MNTISDIDYFKNKVTKALRLPDLYLKDNRPYSTAYAVLLMEDLYWAKLVKDINNANI